MKLLEILEHALPTLQEFMPKKMLWSIILFHYGLQVVVVIIYIIDWLVGKGQRQELIELLQILQ